MEAGKSHNMLFTTSWRTRETRAGRFQSEGRRRWMSQLKKKENSPFLYLFVLLGPSTAWVMPTHTGEGRSLLSLLMQMLFFSGNTLTDNPRNNVLPAIWAPPSPVKLVHKINCHEELFSVRFKQPSKSSFCTCSNKYKLRGWGTWVAQLLSICLRLRS